MSQLADQSARSRKNNAFSEAATWRKVEKGWQQVHGSFAEEGISFEWHDFKTSTPLDWAPTFHPESLELCLNLEGTGLVATAKSQVQFTSLSGGFYRHGKTALRAQRQPGRHRFFTVEYSFTFLRKHLAKSIDLHPVVVAALKGNESAAISDTKPLTAELQRLVETLRHPPVLASAQNLWYHSKALELAVAFFFRSQAAEELFCHRQKQIAQERVEKVIAILKRNLAEPPSLEEIGREVGCSHFYLSRTFSTETGQTIPQFLRNLRLERAAELLSRGECNVTEAALEVGYSSLSHFSQAFHQTFGCCPGLYPLKGTQKPN
ncbi:MAG: helix-turn-helix transcriptional regulator [Limisphaerales bacterium]